METPERLEYSVRPTPTIAAASRKGLSTSRIYRNLTGRDMVDRALSPMPIRWLHRLTRRVLTMVSSQPFSPSVTAANLLTE